MRWTRHLILVRLRRRGQGRVPSRNPSSRLCLGPSHHQQRRGRQTDRREENGRRFVSVLLCLLSVSARQRPGIVENASF